MVLVKSVEVDLSVKGDADAKAKLDAIDARAQELKRNFPAFALKVDSAAAGEKLKVFRAEMADAAKDRTANLKVKVDDSALQKLQKDLQKTADSAKSGGPGLLISSAALLTPAIGTLGAATAAVGVGLAGAFTAGAGALAAFGAVAKPVLTSALTASQAVNTAQNTYNATIAAGVPKAQAQAALQLANSNAQLTYNAAVAGGAKPATALAAEHLTLAKNQATYNSATNTGTFNAKAYAAEQLAIGKAYADLSPAQIALSKQLGDMANAWQNLKAAQTPVVAGALVPWLKSVTDLTGNLAPIIREVSPVIKDLGTGFDALINSPQFKAFRDFIANTGSNAVSAAGGTLIDLIDAFIILLPKFNPLIEKAVGWIGELGPAVLNWSASKRASDDIQAFMQFFTTNGPAVGGFLKSIGGALKALAPGLTSGGALELKVISDFLGWVAKLPPAFAKPLAEAAGALLVLNKLGVFSVGVKIVGAAAKWLTGGVVNLGGGAAAGAEIRAAMVSGGTAAAAEIRAAMATGGAVAGTEEAGAVTGGAATAGMTFGAAAAAALLLAVVAFEAGKSANNVLNYFKPSGGAGPALSPGGTTPGAFTSFVPQSVVSQANAQNATAAASPQGQGVINLTAQGKLVQAYALDLQGLNSVFTAQAKTAKTAQDALDTYTASVKSSGTTSLASKTDAALLVSWLQSVGVNSGKAQTDVAAYTAAIVKNGVNSSQAGAARRQVISDILNASTNARKGQTDLSNYTAAVQQDGIKSSAAQGARAQLIKDLENAGLSAHDATSWVNGLGTSVKNLPAGKTIKITMDGTGLYTITGSVIAKSQGPGGSGNAAGGLAAGGFIRMGSGPTADDVPAMLSRGELVVPANMVRAGAVDHLRGRLPGFASGGQVSGNLTPGFISGMSDMFTKEMTDAMVAAMQAAIRAAAAAAKAAAASAGGASAGMGGVSNASGVAALKSAAAKHGWTSAAEWAALNNVEMREAAYSLTATNPSSGAYGMAQFINGASEYAQYGGNSTTYAGQATAMANYIACVPLDGRILTREGWKTHEQVRVGDETPGYDHAAGKSRWTKVTAVHHYEDAPVTRLSSNRVSLRSTANHRWLTEKNIQTGKRTYRREEFTQTQDISTRHRIRLAARHDDLEGLPVTLVEAELLGWIAGDGHTRYPTRNSVSSSVFQSEAKPKQLAALRVLLETTPHTEYTRPSVAGRAPIHQFRLRSPYVRDLFNRSGYEGDLELMVLAMSADQRAAFVAGLLEADGYQRPGDGSWTFAQNDGPVLRAFILAAFLMGYWCNATDSAGQKHVVLHTAYVGSGSGFAREELERQPVWCVTTELGSWTVEQDGQVFLTGNSRYGDPIAAWAHEQAFGWYGSGLDAIFRRPTLIGVGERGPERVQVTPGGSGGGDLIAEVRALRAELRQLTGVAAAIPAKTGQHVGGAINGAAAQGSFRARYS